MTAGLPRGRVFVIVAAISPIVLAVAWVVIEPAYPPVRLAVFVVALAAAFTCYLTGTKYALPGIVRAGIYAALPIVACVEISRTLDGFADGIHAYIAGLDEISLVLLVVPPASLVMCLVFAGDVTGSARRRERRRTARSDLYGKARLRGTDALRELTRGPGILLGQLGAGTSGRLVSWPLEGSAMTLAPPRTGKGATIALNLLAPGNRGMQGSTLLIDPRGEMWCVVARRRREMGRNPVLLDPFGLVAAHADAFDELSELECESAFYNPLDFIRDDDALAVRDIDVLLDGLLTPPPQRSSGASLHFHVSAREIIAGYIAWVKFDPEEQNRTLARVREHIMQASAAREEFQARVLGAPRYCNGLAQNAVERQLQVGNEEAGAQFSTIANQLAFLNYPELLSHTSRSTFDPADLASGNMDVFVVVPDDMLDRVRSWLRLWITIPNALANRQLFRKEMLFIIDEMPRLGYLQPVMDAYNLAAGKGIKFWCFAQSVSSLDSSWGRENRKILIDLAEVVQILGFPRTDASGADEFSRAIGTATFEAWGDSRSGSSSGHAIFDTASRLQAGRNRSLVRERIVTPDDLMGLGQDEQIVIAAGKSRSRDAFRLSHARYWQRRDCRPLHDPNPFVLRKGA